MLTAEKLDAIAPEARTALWRSMCTDLHGTGSYRAAMARRLGVSTSAAFRWERGDSVPHMALMLVEMWLMRRAIRDAGATAEALTRLAEMVD